MRSLKTFFVVVASAVILSGCYVTSGEMTWAHAVCQAHGGVDVLWTHTEAECLDGTKIKRAQ